MGVGICVKCNKCGFSKDITSGYGGLYDHHEFECRDCKKYFHKKCKHIDVDIPWSGRFIDRLKLSVEIEEMIFNCYRRVNLVKCEYCKGKNVKELIYKDIFKNVNELEEETKLNLKCPVCNENLYLDGEFFFDD